MYGWVILPTSISNRIKAKMFLFVGRPTHLSFGDSITEQSLWQSVFKTYANTNEEVIKRYSGEALWTNCIQITLQNKIGSVDFDFMTIMFGTNDWGQSRNIGTIDDTNPNGEYTGTFFVLILMLSVGGIRIIEAFILLLMLMECIFIPIMLGQKYMQESWRNTGGVFNYIRMKEIINYMVIFYSNERIRC